MHRIDTSTATPDNRFTEGDPAIPVPATVVSAEWLNAVQEELAAVITGAGLELDKAENEQLRQAIGILVAGAAPGLATTESPGLVQIGSGLSITAQGLLSVLTATAAQAGIVRPDGTTCTVNDGVLSALPPGEADTGQSGIVRLTDALNSRTSRLAASDTAVATLKDQLDAAVAAAGKVTLKGSRSTAGVWTLTGLSIGRPLIILQDGPAERVGSAEFWVTSGADDGYMGGGYGYQTGYYYGGWISSNCFIAIPTATSVTINLKRITDTATLRAYQ